MGRAAALARQVTARVFRLALTLSLAAAAPLCLAQAGEAPQPADSPFALRIVMAGGPIDDVEVRRHIEFSLDRGFNAIWVSGDQAGAWTAEAAPRRPGIRPEFVEFADWCRERGARLFVAVRPVAATRGNLVFSASEPARRLRRFARLLQRKAGVRDVVVSFQGDPLLLENLGDLLEFGRTTAPAHVDLVRRLRDGLRPATRLWLAPAIFDDARLGDGRIRYSASLLDSVKRLDAGVGIVWSGPEQESRAIAANDLAATRLRFGGRALLLQDRFPANQAGDRLALAAVLGPLRHREPGIASEIAGYVACPMAELGASRLSLLTTADFLRDPLAYDPDESWQRAISRLAGDDAQAGDALKTQAIEWGGWIGERNYRTARSDNPEAAARALRDPAVVASWGWVVRRYPERMSHMMHLADGAFRDDLLEVMARRLAIARAVPIVRELRARFGAGRRDVGSLVAQLQRGRERSAEWPSARLALDRFLVAAGLANVLEEETGAERPSTGTPRPAPGTD